VNNSSDGPVTYNFHPDPVTVISPWHLAIYIYCVCGCAAVVLILAVLSFRSLAAGGFSLSLSKIGFTPIILGLFIQYGVIFAFEVVQAFRIVVAPSGDLSHLLYWTSGCLIMGRVLGCGSAGAAVWRLAGDNKFGHVIMTWLVTAAIDATLLLWTSIFLHLPISHFRYLSIEMRSFIPKECLTAALLMGARLVQKSSSPKPPPRITLTP
jgi:hypothetical protein